MLNHIECTQIKFKLQNYRAVGMEPVFFELRPGITAIIGPNNVGKSVLFQFLSSFRAVLPKVDGIALALSAKRDMNGRFQPRKPGIDGFVKHSDHQSRPTYCQFDFPTPNSTASDHQSLYFYFDHESRIQARPEDLGRDTENCVAAIHGIRYFPATRYINYENQGSQIDLPLGREFCEAMIEWKAGKASEQALRFNQVVRDLAAILQMPNLDLSWNPSHRQIQLIYGESLRLMSELGTGVAQIIHLVLSAAFADASWLLIDEPELNLHPAMQIELVSRLRSYVKYGLVIATHSYGLARSVADFTYCASHDGRFLSIKAVERDVRASHTLAALTYGLDTVRQTRVLLVEGIHDVLVMKRIAKLIEPSAVVFVLSIGGGELVAKNRQAELHELIALAGGKERVAVIIDSERADQGARIDPRISGFEDDCMNCGIACCILKRRALENYLPSQAVKAVLGDEAEALGEYQALAEGKVRWAKWQNIEIAQKMKREDVVETDLGKFLTEFLKDRQGN